MSIIDGVCPWSLTNQPRFLNVHDQGQTPWTFSVMRAITRFRTRIENSAIKAPNWLPHADFFLSALFFVVKFDQFKLTDKKYLLSFNKWISSTTNDQAYSSFTKLTKHIDKIVSKNEFSYGYNHPKFFKTQAEYDKWFRPLSAKTNIKSPQSFKT